MQQEIKCQHTQRYGADKCKPEFGAYRHAHKTLHKKRGAWPRLFSIAHNYFFVGRSQPWILRCLLRAIASSAASIFFGNNESALMLLQFERKQLPSQRTAIS